MGWGESFALISVTAMTFLVNFSRIVHSLFGASRVLDICGRCWVEGVGSFALIITPIPHTPLIPPSYLLLYAHFEDNRIASSGISWTRQGDSVSLKRTDFSVTKYQWEQCNTPGYGVVPKGLLTFLGSLYKEVPKTTSRILVYPGERRTARKMFSSFEKHSILDLECRILSQEPPDSCILYFNVIFHGK